MPIKPDEATLNDLSDFQVAADICAPQRMLGKIDGLGCLVSRATLHVTFPRHVVMPATVSTARGGAMSDTVIDGQDVETPAGEDDEAVTKPGCASNNPRGCRAGLGG